MLRLIAKVRRTTTTVFSDVVDMKRGVLFDKDLLTSRKTSEHSHRYFEGDIYRYHTVMTAPSWIEYGPKMREYPKEFKWFTGPRILLRRLVNRQQRLMASFIEDTVVTNKNLYTLIPKPSCSWGFVLGILNSKLISRFYIAMVSQSTKDDFPQVTISDLLDIPFPALDLTKPSDVTRYSEVARLAEAMLRLHKDLENAKTPNEQETIQQQIAATDAQIDQLVYELYGLAADETKIIEGNAH